VNEQRATRLIPGTPDRIHTVLTTPAALPDWNPAIHTLTGTGRAEIGRRYPITARGNLSGHLYYPVIEADRIEIHFKVQGLEEKGYWQLTQDGAATLVEHGFSHHGPLAVVLSAAFRGVVDLRLDRLGQRAAALT